MEILTIKKIFIVASLSKASLAGQNSGIGY